MGHKKSGAKISLSNWIVRLLPEAMMRFKRIAISRLEGQKELPLDRGEDQEKVACPLFRL